MTTLDKLGPDSGTGSLRPDAARSAPSSANRSGPTSGSRSASRATSTRPGYRLVLGTIAGELDMSVVPVREAVRQLEAEGLVTFERNVGARVTDRRRVASTSTRMQTLGILEGSATALSAPLPDGRRPRPRARRSTTACSRTLDHFDPRAVHRAQPAVPLGPVRAVPEPPLLELVHREWSRLGRLRDSTFSFVPGRAQQSVDEHESILDLIRERRRPARQIEMAARRSPLAHDRRVPDARASRRDPRPPDLSDLPRRSDP